MIQFPVYLDNNATTPCDPRVLEAMLPYFTRQFGNAASRDHAYGWQAQEAVDIAREQVAGLIGAGVNEIIFTSGATEAVNLAIKGVWEKYAGKGNHIITAATEHSAVIDSCAHLAKLGADITMLPVDGDGLVSLADLEAAIRPTTVLIAIMYANNETGVLQPIPEIGRIARKYGVLFFTDATQAVGKITVNVETDCIDLMAFSGHKIYGPKGVGALYVRRRNPKVHLTRQQDGGDQEQGLRSGTLNVPAIVGFGSAAWICGSSMAEERTRTATLRDRLEQGLLELEGALLNGGRKNRLPQVTNISFAATEGESLISGLNRDLAISTGSACTSASLEPSHVLKAMGRSDLLARNALRFGLGRFTTAEEIDFALERVTNAVRQARETSSERHLLNS